MCYGVPPLIYTGAFLVKLNIAGLKLRYGLNDLFHFGICIDFVYVCLIF